jgi:hypothetical protein
LTKIRKKLTSGINDIKETFLFSCLSCQDAIHET